MITITGPSGVGKSYLKRYLKDIFNFEEIPVYTTRKPRKEEDSTERIYLTEEEFKDKYNKNEFIFVDKIYDAGYAFMASDLREGNNTILELYIDNVEKFRKLYPSTIMIALITNSQELLENRLKNRGENNIKRLCEWEEEVQKIRDNKNLFNLVYNIDKNTENKILIDMEEYIQGCLKC